MVHPLFIDRAEQNDAFQLAHDVRAKLRFPRRIFLIDRLHDGIQHLFLRHADQIVADQIGRNEDRNQQGREAEQ